MKFIFSLLTFNPFVPLKILCFSVDLSNILLLHYLKMLFQNFTKHQNLNNHTTIVSKMIKQKSQSLLKSKSKDKNSLQPTSSIRKIQASSHIISKNMNKTVAEKKEKRIQVTTKGNNLSKEHKSQSRNPKGKQNTVKYRGDVQMLNMKKQLKHMITKNKAVKAKQTDPVPEILKHIQKNCKILKAIHQKQKTICQKRSSYEFQRNQKINCPQNQNQIAKIKSKYSKLKKANQYPSSSRNTRFSLDQPFFIKNHKEQKGKNHKVASLEKQNMIEMLQKYKKSFDIENMIAAKSSQNTNYNTNQSKNSSSLFNSHGHSTSMYLSIQFRSKIQQKCNYLQKIQTLINSQKRNLQIDVNQPILQPQQSAHFKVSLKEPLSNIIGQKDKKQIFPDDLQMEYQNSNDNLLKMQGQNPSFLVRDEIPFELFQQQLGQQQKKKISPIQFFKSRNVNEMGFNNHIQKQHSPPLQIQKSKLQQKFIKSKFYVQPIPNLINKASSTAFQRQPHKQDEGSLMGCQITLLQNNLIQDDSQIESFEL